MPGAAIDWTPELTTSIIEGIEAGNTLRQVAQSNGISASAIIRQVQANEEFAKQYARAMDIRTDADFDGLIDEFQAEPPSTEHGTDSGWVAWKRLQIDTIKWSLSKRCPKKYGDKLAHTGADGEGPVAFQIVSTVPRPPKE